MRKSYINNPHSFDMLSTPLSYWIFNRRPHKKYQFFFDEFLKDGGRVCFDFSETSFGRLDGIWRILTPFIFLEILIWAWINKVPFKRLSFLPEKHSNVVLFSYKGATEYSFLKARNLAVAYKIFWHLSHYMILTEQKSNFIKMYKEKSWFLADCDISGNPLFRKYFSTMLNRPILLVPFVPEQRFTHTPRNELRISSHIYATGTYHRLESKDNCDEAIGIFQKNCHHYLRDVIADGKFDWIDNGQGDYRQQEGLKRSLYFNRNLVDTFNEFAFIVCGDELNGLPAISNLEAMCCGAMPILKEENYKGLGLIKGIHYLSHDGTIDSVLEAFEGHKNKVDRGLYDRTCVRVLLMSANFDSIKKIKF